MSALMQSLANLGLTWINFYPTWGSLGANFGQLGANLGHLGAATSARIWLQFKGHLRPISGQLAANPRPSSRPKNTVRKHLSKSLSRPLRARSAELPWLSGRFWGACAQLDPATEPSRAHLCRVAKRFVGAVVADANTDMITQRLTLVKLP